MLLDIEPILRCTDGVFQPSHPSFQEVLTAAQFADEINSGALSVEDAWKYVWSYKENAELWNLPQDREWRALLPAWQNVLLFLIGQLDDETAGRLVDIVAEGYFQTEGIVDKKKYNPYFDDLAFAGRLASHQKRKDDIRLDGLVAALVLYGKELGDGEDTIKALGNIRSEKAIDFLIGYVRDYDFSFGSKYSYLAAKALAEIGTERAIGFLVDSIGAEDEDDVATRVLGETKSDLTISLLLKLLDNPHYTFQKNVIWILGEIKSERAVPKLLEYIQNDHNRYLSHAFQALGKIGTEAALDALCKYLKDNTKRYRCEAMDTLGNLAQESAIPIYACCLQDQDQLLRFGACAALGLTRSDQAVPFLKTHLYSLGGSTYDLIERLAILQALGKIGTKYAVNVLIRYLGNDKNQDREVAAEQLMKIGSPEAIEAVNEYAEADTPIIDIQSQALRITGCKDTVSALIDYAGRVREPATDEAIRMLGEIRDPNAVPFLGVHILNDRNPYRETALFALAEIASEAALPALIKYVTVAATWTK